MVHRSRIDIMKCILECSDESSSKTKLVQVCSVSLPQFRLYESFLVQAELLEASGTTDANTFKTTKKGREFVRDYARVRSLLETNPEKREGGEKVEGRTSKALVQDDCRRSGRH